MSRRSCVGSVYRMRSLVACEQAHPWVARERRRAKRSDEKWVWWDRGSTKNIGTFRHFSEYYPFRRAALCVNVSLLAGQRSFLVYKYEPAKQRQFDGGFSKSHAYRVRGDVIPFFDWLVWTNPVKAVLFKNSRTDILIFELFVRKRFAHLLWYRTSVWSSNATNVSTKCNCVGWSHFWEGNWHFVSV